jgi:hypothetical protein
MGPFERDAADERFVVTRRRGAGSKQEEKQREAHAFAFSKLRAMAKSVT